MNEVAAALSSTQAMTFTVTCPPLGMSPIAQVTVPEMFVQPSEASENASPGGTGSVIVTPVASLGPALEAVSV